MTIAMIFTVVGYGLLQQTEINLVNITFYTQCLIKWLKLLNHDCLDILPFIVNKSSTVNKHIDFSLSRPGIFNQTRMCPYSFFYFMT